jgi:tRNA G18 (ribose-2'-O)-methylase SpoU
MCIVIGNEEIGIKKELQTLGTCVTLPQRTPDISYNASIAASILMFLMEHTGAHSAMHQKKLP